MMRKTETGVEIELTTAQYNMLLLALGAAIDLAMRDGNAKLVRHFIRLANSINEGNPDWTPYEVPPSQASNRGQS